MADFTKLLQTPYKIRYYVYAAAGSAKKNTLTEILTDLTVSGPLKTALSKLTATWGASADAYPTAAANPFLQKNLSITLTPYTYQANAYGVSAASVQAYNNGSNNVLEVLGGETTASTIGTAETNAILEIRFDHSAVR